MASYLSTPVGKEKGGSPRDEWGIKHIFPLTFKGDYMVLVLDEKGAVVHIPHSQACVVLTNMTGHGGDRRGEFLGFFPLKDAWVDTCKSPPRKGRPAYGDTIVPLGEPNFANPAIVVAYQQFARDYMGGGSDMHDNHIFVMFYAVLQCLIFEAQKTPALLSAIVPLVRVFANGHLHFKDWPLVTIQMTEDVALNDQTQKAMSHRFAAFLAKRRPDLFVKSPLIPWDRRRILECLRISMERGFRNGSGLDISKNAGIFGIHCIVPLFDHILDTAHAPLDPALIPRITARFTAERDTIQAAFDAKKGSVQALVSLTTLLPGSTPLTDAQATGVMRFCGTNHEPTLFPDWEELGILPRRPKTVIEESLVMGPFHVSTSGGMTDVAQLEPTLNPLQAILRPSKGHEWHGVLLRNQGNWFLEGDMRGIMAQASGRSGETGVANWRTTYGTLKEANVMDPTRWGFASTGVICDPRITGPAKWIKPSKAYVPPGVDAKIRIHFVRPNMVVFVDDKEHFRTALPPDEYPVFSFKGSSYLIRCELLPPSAEESAAASAAPVKASSGAAAVAMGGAGAPSGGYITPAATAPPPTAASSFFSTLAGALSGDQEFEEPPSGGGAKSSPTRAELEAQLAALKLKVQIAELEAQLAALTA